MYALAKFHQNIYLNAEQWALSNVLETQFRDVCARRSLQTQNLCAKTAIKSKTHTQTHTQSTFVYAALSVCLVR